MPLIGLGSFTAPSACLLEKISIGSLISNPLCNTICRTGSLIFKDFSAPTVEIPANAGEHDMLKRKAEPEFGGNSSTIGLDANSFFLQAFVASLNWRLYLPVNFRRFNFFIFSPRREEPALLVPWLVGLIIKYCLPP